MNKTPWTDSEIRSLTHLYADTPTKDIANRLGRTDRQIYSKAAALGLKKSEAYLAGPYSCRLRRGDSIGSGTRFKPGLTPWNKGQPHPSRGRSAETQFQQGQDPHNTQLVGSYRLDKDGTLQRKINNDKGNNSVRWRSVHELVWTEANGPVPPKHIVVFRPGARTNVIEDITLDKVECISLAENMRRNTLHRYPKEIALAIQTRAALNRRINSVEKQNNQ